MASAQITALLPGVYEITGHPEMEAETVRAIRAAVQYYHKLDFLRFDNAHVEVATTPDVYDHSIDIAAELPYFRAVDAIHLLDASGNVLAANLTEITPRELLDSYGVRRSNVYYNAGQNIVVHAGVLAAYIQVFYFTLPDIGEETLVTWLLPDNEQAILDYAAMRIFKQLGMKEKMAATHGDVQLHSMQILQNYSRLSGT